MLGSDYPFPLGEHHPGKLIESIDDMDDDTKVRLILKHKEQTFQCFLLQDQLMAGNALEFLGLDPAQFT